MRCSLHLDNKMLQMWLLSQKGKSCPLCPAEAREVDRDSRERREEDKCEWCPLLCACPFLPCAWACSHSVHHPVGAVLSHSCRHLSILGKGAVRFRREYVWKTPIGDGSRSMFVDDPRSFWMCDHFSPIGRGSTAQNSHCVMAECRKNYFDW